MKVESEWSLPCPICQKNRTFKSKSYFYKAKRGNKSCRSCSNSLKAGGDGIVLYNEKGQKCCIDCKEYKNADEYYNNKFGKISVCKSCSHKRSKVYHKDIYRYKKYGITKEEFEKLETRHSSTCPICEKPLIGEIHIDHCHISGKVRGILCGKCNKGLGQFDDNIIFLTNAIKYLKNE